MLEFIQEKNPISVPTVAIHLAEKIILRHMLELIQGKNPTNALIVLIHSVENHI
jgi:hypothetical protein